MTRKYSQYRGYLLADRRFYEELGNAGLDYDLEHSLRTLESPEVDVRINGVWAICRPRTLPDLQPHGWKIHVSATPDLAMSALDAVIAEFTREPFHFKCLRDYQMVVAATSRWWPTGHTKVSIKVGAVHTSNATDSIRWTHYPHAVPACST